MSTQFQFRYAAHIIHHGGIVAYPTEAIFGLGCNPLDGAAVARILAIKGRNVSKGLILIAADVTQILPFITELPALQSEKIKSTWPGPTTWILPVNPKVPSWLTGGRATIAIRVTAHPDAANLCRACKMALVSTSANRSGFAPTRQQLQVQRWFGTSIDYLLPGACGSNQRPSRIIDARSGLILR